MVPNPRAAHYGIKRLEAPGKRLSFDPARVR